MDLKMALFKNTEPSFDKNCNGTTKSYSSTGSPKIKSPTTSLKRKFNSPQDCRTIPSKKKKKVMTGKKSANALCFLHNLYRNLDFKIISQEGPVHAPIFTAIVEINKIKFEGKGRSKKLAKHSAAEAALRSLIQFKNPSLEAPVLDSIKLSDFTSDALYEEINNFGIKAEGNNTVTLKAKKNKNGVLKPNLSKSKVLSLDKNPVMLLNEIHPDAKYEIISDKGEQSFKYTMSVLINGQRFEERGSSKKLSKVAAARSALLSFHSLAIPSHPTVQLVKPCVTNSTANQEIYQVFCDNISKLINDKFFSLMSNDSTHLRRKILAGFVISENYALESCKLIALATGTKCVNGERMSVNGTVVNDSHAEIIARRCLCNFFYGELEKHLNNNTEDCIFELHENGFRLKSKYKVHLYISSAPCGDSRIFSPHDNVHWDKHPNRKARGQLRTKIECGEGTIPVKSGHFVQTWDGVLQGERLLTMSCSDKIAKWNVVGLQGALLSNFLQPVYLDSIILGSLFHPHHLHRAINGRIATSVQGLPPPYRLNVPKLATILNNEPRQIGKTPSFSVNWTIGDDKVEVVNAISGKTEDNQISRLSKCRLFYRFMRLAGKIPSITGLGVPKGPLSYTSCKEAATNFQVAKKQLFEAFSRANLGEWVKKPPEVNLFEWDEKSLTELLFPKDDSFS